MKHLFFLLFFTLTLSLSVNAQSTVQENLVEQKIKVFPNPATNVVNILGVKNSLKADIAITDTYGNTALNFQWSIKNNALNIPIANLKSGIYIVTIRSQEQQVQTKFYKK